MRRGPGGGPSPSPAPSPTKISNSKVDYIIKGPAKVDPYLKAEGLFIVSRAKSVKN